MGEKCNLSDDDCKKLLFDLLRLLRVNARGLYCRCCGVKRLGKIAMSDAGLSFQIAFVENLRKLAIFPHVGFNCYTVLSLDHLPTHFPQYICKSDPAKPKPL